MDNNNTGVTIQDLQILHEVAKLAAERGAIKANEMSTVGAAFDRVSIFLKNIVDMKSTAKDTIPTPEALNAAQVDQNTNN